MGLANMLMKLEISYSSEEARQLVRDVWGEMQNISDEASFRKAENFGTFPNFECSSLRHGKPKRNAIVRTLAPTVSLGKQGCFLLFLQFHRNLIPLSFQLDRLQTPLLRPL